MMLEIVRRGNEFFVRLPNNFFYKVFSFLWNYFLAGLALAFVFVASPFFLIIVMVAIFVRFETIIEKKDEKPTVGAPAPGTYGKEPK